MTQHSVKVQDLNDDEVAPLRKRVREFVGFDEESMQHLATAINEWLIENPGCSIISVHHACTSIAGAEELFWTYTALLEITR